jgi:hypothetical protein
MFTNTRSTKVSLKIVFHDGTLPEMVGYRESACDSLLMAAMRFSVTAAAGGKGGGGLVYRRGRSHSALDKGV